MDIKKQVKDMDSLVGKGAIVEAVQTYFAESASTSDYGKVSTTNKSQMIEKMEGFTSAIAAVNGITHHHSIVDGNVSASEFTFDFDMKDGSKIFWHEVIRRVWDQDGKVTNEVYFNANN